MSCTVDHGGGPCSWEAGIPHGMKDSLTGDLFEFSKRLMLTASRSQGRVGEHDSEPGWQGPTTEEWVRRIAGPSTPVGESLPWIKR